MKYDDVSNFRDREFPLVGISVLEVGGSLPSRMLAKLLKDQGADVTHLVVASRKFPVLDFDEATEIKEIDLESEPGIAALVELLDRNSVLVDGLGGEGLAEFGFGYERLRDQVSQLLYCRLKSMPDEGPEVPFELVEWIVAGELGLHRAGLGEMCEPLSLASAYGAMQAAVYLIAGLIHRERSSVGSEIRVSLFGAAIMVLNRRLLKVKDPAFGDPLGKFRLPIQERYTTLDGRTIQCQGAVETVAKSVLHALGLDQWQDEALAGITAFATQEQEELWRARFAKAFASRTATEWESAIAGEGGAAAICRSRDEWIHEQHARDAEIFVETDNGDMRVGPGVRVFAGEKSLTAPNACLWPPVAPSNRLPLAGLRVIDLAIILAGPTCGRLLGELGADVIKIDAPDRLGLPWVSPYGWLDVNRTKRSILVDLKTEEGREILWKLLETADVLLENYRAGKIAELGFTFENIAKRNSKIVHVSLNAYDYGGSFTGRPGWEQNAQAMSAMQTSRAKDGIPKQVPVPINDFGTGYLGAYGTLLGVFAARHSGKPQRVLGSLSRTGTFIQAVEYGNIPAIENRDNARSTESRSIQFFAVPDGMIAVEASPSDAAAISKIIGAKDVTEAVANLRTSGFTAHIARTPEDLLDTKWVRDVGLLDDWNHPKWGMMTNVFAHAKASAFEIRRGWPAENPGERTVEVLDELGYSEQEITQLINSHIVYPEQSLFHT
ncbi:MAG TPA: CoA transferase [Acidimicrobiales bacterium]|nr:CoA transferase [Acidimicrobiales bacterium]